MLYQLGYFRNKTNTNCADKDSVFLFIHQDILSKKKYLDVQQDKKYSLSIKTRYRVAAAQLLKGVSP
jgi:hypothetical protein